MSDDAPFAPAPKTGVLNWDQVLAIRTDTNDADYLSLELDRVSRMLVDANVQPSDPQITLERMLQAFRVAQLLIELADAKAKNLDSQLYMANAKNQDVEIENKRLRNLSAKSTDPTFIEIRNLKDELIMLEQQNVAARRDLERAEESLDAERSVVAQLTVNLKDEKARSGVLQDTNKRLDEEVKSLRNQLSDQRTRIQSRNIDQDQFKLQLTEKNAELNRYIAEVQMLSTENKHMSEEIELMAQELEAAVGELERNGKELQEARDLLDGNDALIEDLTDERDALQIKIEDLAEQLEQQGDNHDGVEDELRNELNDVNDVVAELKATIRNKDVEIRELEADVAACRKALAVSTSDDLKNEISQKEATIRSLTEKLQESQRDFEVLSVDWDRLDQYMQATKSDLHSRRNTQQTAREHSTAKGIRDQLESTKKLKEQIQVCQDRQKEDAAKIKALQTQLEDKENAIVDLRERLDIYEQGTYGLRDAVAEVKSLKLQVSIRDSEIEDYAQQINDLAAQSADLAEENSDLRQKLGMDPQSPIDIANLKSTKTVELEKYKSLSIRLQKEIEKLEDERLQLKASLRLHAMERGERAISLGLTAKDLAAIEDYADKLRMGQRPAVPEVPVVPVVPKPRREEPKPPVEIIRPVLNIAQLDKLTLELERIHTDAADTKSRLMALQDDYRKLLEENGTIQAAVTEVSQALIRHADDVSDGHAHPFPMVEQLVSLLQSKFKQTPVADAIAHVERSTAKVSRQLRIELEDSRKQSAQLLSQIDTLKSQLDAAAAETADLKTKLGHRERRFVDLPAELTLSSVNGYSSLVDQLITCVADLHEREDELKQSERVLEQCQDAYEELNAKTLMLFRDHQQLKQSHESEVAALKASVKDAQGHAEIAQERVHKLETMVASIQTSSTDQLKRAGIEAQRKLIVLEVNEKLLTRRYMALSEVESHLRRENSKLREDMTSMEKSARETILRIHRQKRDCEDLIDNLQTQLSESVPQQQHALLENRLSAQISKTRLLLERERDWIEHRMSQESASNRVVQLEKDVERLSLQLLEARSTADKLQGLLDAQPNQDAGSATSASKDRQTVATLQVQIEVLEKRTELAESKVKALETVESELNARLDTLDRLYMDSKQESLRIQEDLLQVQNEYTGGANRQQYEAMLAEQKTLKDEIQSLRNDVHKYKDLSDISANQAADLIHLRKMDEKERDILRSAVQELQMENDDKLIIGKLHHHILALQMSEAMALRKLETLNVKCARLETTTLQMEQAKDERDRLLFSLRMETKSRMRLMQKTVTELRLKLSGVVLLSKHERACDTMRMLDDRKRAAEAQLAKLKTEKRDIEGRLDDAQLRMSEQNNLIAALKDATNAQKRVAAWHTKMLTSQIDLIKHKRELVDMRTTSEATKRELKASQTRASELEDALLSLQNEIDQQQLEWEMRQGELENTIQQYEEERDQIFQCATAGELKDMLPDRALPIGQQLETALRMLVERSKQVKVLEFKLQQVDTELGELKSKLKENSDALVQKDSDIISLQLKVASSDARQNVEKSEKSLAIDMGVFEIARERETEAIRIAKATIESLRRQIEQKEELVDKYREMVKSVRKDVVRLTQDHRVELEKKEAMINELRNDRISRATKVPDISPGPGSKEVEHDDDAIDRMQRLLAAKEAAHADLQKKLDQLSVLQADAVESKQALQSRLDELQMTLDEKDGQIAAKTEDIAMLHKEMAELRRTMEETVQEIESRPQPPDLTDTVKRLESDIEQRDAKLSSLNKVINKLKAQLIETAKLAAKSKIQHSNENINFQELLEAKTSDLTSKAMQLEAKTKRMAAAIETHKSDKANLETDVMRLTEELAKREKEVVAKSAENMRLQKALRETQEGIASKLPMLGPEPPLPAKSVQSGGVSSTTGGLVGSEGTSKTDKWELEKKYIRKVETLKTKLHAKIQESDELGKTVEALKQSLSRSENGRLRLQSKLGTLSAKMSSLKTLVGKEHASNTGDRAAGSDADATRDSASTSKKSHEDLATMRQMIERLQSDADANMRDMVAKNQELLAKRTEISQLQDKVRMLEEVNEQLHKSGSAFSADVSPTMAVGESLSGAKSPGIVATLESRIKDLMDKANQAENDKMRAESAMIQVKYESDRAAAELKRLQAKMGELEQRLEAYERGLAPLPQASAALFKTLGSKSHEDLVAVIEHLTKVADRLQADNESLRKANVPHAKYAELLAEVKRLKKERAEMDEKQRGSDQAGTKVARIEEENTKLRRHLRRETDKLKRLQSRVDELSLTKEQLLTEVVALRKALGGIDVPITTKDEIVELKEHILKMQQQLDEKEAILQKLMRPDANEQARLMADNRRLSRELEIWSARANKLSEKMAQRDLGLGPTDKGPSMAEVRAAVKRAADLETENKELRAMLDEHAAKPQVHEELEDLKHNYREALRLNMQLEEQLKRRASAS